VLLLDRRATAAAAATVLLVRSGVIEKEVDERVAHFRGARVFVCNQRVKECLALAHELHGGQAVHVVQCNGKGRGGGSSSSALRGKARRTARCDGRHGQGYDAAVCGHAASIFGGFTGPHAKRRFLAQQGALEVVMEFTQSGACSGDFGGGDIGAGNRRGNHHVAAGTM
jgi:hypothetical protein